MSLKYELSGTEGITFVLLHFLGGSTREWDEVVALLTPSHRTLAIDLPGFGGSASETGYSVAEMADAVEAAIAAAGVKEYVLVGHSMGGKVAAVLARRAQDARAKDLLGLVLVAPSPPGPEPMAEEKRGSMIALLGASSEDESTRARNYITKNEQRDIPKAIEDRATNEVLRMDRTAWVAWLTHGSKEDWTERVGVLHLPALVVAGGKDLSLGPKTQAEVTMAHLGNGRLVTIEGCSHLLPMECPEKLAPLLLDFAAGLGGPVVPTHYQEFISGERVSPRTREVIEARVAGSALADGVFTAEQERTLRAVMARVLPQGGDAVDLASGVIARLAGGKGDGWRYAVLPVDLEAYRAGLDALAREAFEKKNAEDQDAALEKLAAKKGSVEARWFEEVRSDAAEGYVAHPATLARLGYSGIGVGGAETKHRGFVTLGPNEREAWEPVAEAVR